MTNAEPAAARQRMQNRRRRNDKCSGSAMTKSELAVRQGREQRHDEGKTGGATMKGAAAQR